MREITFSEADVQAIAHDRYHHPQPRVQRHMEILWLKHHGFTQDRIATLASAARSTVHRCLDDYLEGGLEPTRELPAKPTHSDLGAEPVSLARHFSSNPP